MHGSLVKTAQCHCLHSWIFRALSKMCTLLSHPKSNWMHPCPASTPTSLAFSRPFYSKQEAVDSFPWLFENTKSLIYKENPNFQSLIFFLYCSCGCECCKREKPNSKLFWADSEWSSNCKKEKLATHCKAMPEFLNPKQYWRVDSWNSEENNRLKLQNPHL